MKTNKHVIIIGGGLSGLTLAWLLQQETWNVRVLEAADRLGGRIQTEKGLLGTPLEMGATWFSDLHPQLQLLMKKLHLQAFPQYAKGISLFQTKSFEPAQQFAIPESESPSYRVAGGTQMLIERLASKIPANQLLLHRKVTTIEESGNGLQVSTAHGEKYKAGMVVSCIPPQLLGSQIEFSPALPPALQELLPTVQTWMAGAVKFTLEYAAPFWRDKGFSGMLYSHAGIITEMYDHANFEGTGFGFTGFLNPGCASYTQAVRKEYVLNQLADLMGDEALNYSTYADKVWTGENLLAGNQVIHRPHQNNGHPLMQASYLHDKFHLCGTETATAYAGYMEGAVMAAQAVARRLLAL